MAQLVTLFAVMQTVERDVTESANQSLAVGGTVVSEYLQSRGKQLRTSVEVLAADFGLKQATATSDADTIRSVLENHSGRVRADMALLVDLNGEAVASTLQFGPGDTENVRELLQLVGDRGMETTAVFGGTSYHVFVVPLRAPVTIGWVLLGFRIDEAVAEQITALTGLDVAIITTTSDTSFRVGTTLYVPAEQRLTLQVPFIDGDSTVSVLLQRSLQEAMSPYWEARRGLLFFGFVLIIFVAAAGFVLSSTVSQPLRKLSAASQSMISGNYNHGVDVGSSDEFGELADSFNEMRRAIAEREQKITHQALHDTLTNLPNRSRVLQQLTDTVHSAGLHQQRASVLSIELEGVREISSTLGHKVGDKLVREAAEQVRNKLSNEDVLGHIGTDEFALILKQQDAGSARVCAEKIGHILADGIKIENIDISLQAYVGIAEYPTHSHEPAELLRYAAIARNDAKDNKERVHVYEAGREDEFVRRLRVVHDLRSAIDRREIDVWYQPKISLPDGVIHGAEALVRWNHPDLGFLPPNDFIPAIEQAGTIVELSRHVLARAVEEVRAISNLGIDLHMSVNLSVRDLQDEHLPGYVLDMLQKYDVAPSRLTLEVTESSIMENVERAVLVLECLRDIGVRISMDDFGTGHSSLSQLRKIPLHELKIDRSFVQTLSQDSQNESIVRTTIALAHDLGLEVVAEGVEDEKTMRRLSEFNCEQAQGYLIGKPMPFSDFSGWVRSYKPSEYAERRGARRAFSA
jgi:diguanylate cyclase (GGDEF)-like protein